jgi:hypothetical protein
MNGSQLEVFQGFYDNITATVGCNASNDSLACLRTVPSDNLYKASVGFTFKPLLDGRFLSQELSQSLVRATTPSSAAPSRLADHLS